jgi:hypothetical protein
LYEFGADFGEYFFDLCENLVLGDGEGGHDGGVVGVVGGEDGTADHFGEIDVALVVVNDGVMDGCALLQLEVDLVYVGCVEGD